MISNPPYIAKREINQLSEDIKNFEPKRALNGGNDGLDVIKKVIYKSKYLIKKKGLLAIDQLTYNGSVNLRNGRSINV